MLGAKDPEQVNTMAKQAGEVSGIVHNINNNKTHFNLFLCYNLFQFWCVGVYGEIGLDTLCLLRFLWLINID